MARTDQDQTRLTRIRTFLENAQRGRTLLIQYLTSRVPFGE
jgi:hypothetical protein